MLGDIKPPGVFCGLALAGRAAAVLINCARAGDMGVGEKMLSSAMKALCIASLFVFMVAYIRLLHAAHDVFGTGGVAAAGLVVILALLGIIRWNENAG